MAWNDVLVELKERNGQLMAENWHLKRELKKVKKILKEALDSPISKRERQDWHADAISTLYPAEFDQ